MLIERTNKKLTITLNGNINPGGLQRIIDFARHLELTSKSKAKQKDIDALTLEIVNKWWKRNKEKFIK